MDRKELVAELSKVCLDYFKGETQPTKIVFTFENNYNSFSSNIEFNIREER